MTQVYASCTYDRVPSTETSNDARFHQVVKAMRITHICDPMGNVIGHNLNGSVNYAFFDAFGSLMYLDPSGEFADTHGSRPRDPFWFAGQGGAESGYHDQGLTWGGYPGFILMTHRWYNPALGRFWTSDPLGYEGGLNTYAYCRNNPVNHLDPNSLDLT